VLVEDESLAEDESLVEESALAQIQELIDHPAFTEPVRIMPDTHIGAGAPIGFTMPLGERIVPNIVGVDVGCGMAAANLGDEIEAFDGYERIGGGSPPGDRVQARQDPGGQQHFASSGARDSLQRVAYWASRLATGRHGLRPAERRASSARAIPDDYRYLKFDQSVEGPRRVGHRRRGESTSGSSGSATTGRH